MTLSMDSPKLRELTRAQLQSLAKREVVRAVGKTEDIIRRLIQKHPKGVPVPEGTNDPSPSSAPPQRIMLKIPHRATASHTTVPEASKDHTHPKGEPVTTEPFPSPSSSSEALEQLLYPEDEPGAGLSNVNPTATSPEAPESSNYPPIEHAAFPGEPSPVPSLQYPSFEGSNGNGGRRTAIHPETPNSGCRADEEAEPDEFYDEYGYSTGAPSHYMVVDTLRQFTTLVDTIPTMEVRIAENRCLLRRTEALLEKATPDARDLTVTREYLETFVLAKMKKKRELWDGTANMSKPDRKLRMAWLRAQRKAENEKRWKEANEINAKRGLEPEPFSVFASESDEEEIESLLTTPASSRSGSSKRSREQSVDVGSDGDKHDGVRRKRARAS